MGKRVKIANVQRVMREKRMVNLKCIQCQKPFELPYCRFNSGRKRKDCKYANCFCSVKCRGNHQKKEYSKNNINLNCLNCNKLFISKNYEKTKFCSDKCCRNYRATHKKPIQDGKIDKKCLICDQIFKGNVNKKFCNQKCREIARNKIPKAIIEMECQECHNKFLIPRYESQDRKFCSIACRGKVQGREYAKNKIELLCKNCSKSFIARNHQLPRKKFCCKSCHLSYMTTHQKPKITPRSKLERWIQNKLIILYPLLEIKYNDRIEVNPLELDIYIPSLKLAFELNGAFHYEEIHGKEQLERTQKNDRQKFQRCIEKQISLCVIDTTRQWKVTDKSSQPFLDIITKIINDKLKEYQ